MALDRAQFLAPPSENPLDSIGAVKAGSNITIAADGTISSTGGGSGAVTRLIAGTNITLNPTTGVGDVTISATGGGGGGVTQLVAGDGISLNPTSGTGIVTITNTGGGGGGGVTSLTSSSPSIVLSSSTGNVVIGYQQNVIANYDPIVIIGGGQWSRTTGSGGSGGEGYLTNVNFTIPDGANRASVWSRVRITVVPTNDGDNQVAWTVEPGYRMNPNNCSFSTGNPIGQLQYLSAYSKSGRGVGSSFVRFDTLSIPGSGSRGCSIQVNGLVSQQGGGNATEIRVDAFQIIILPYQL